MLVKHIRNNIDINIYVSVLGVSGSGGIEKYSQMTEANIAGFNNMVICPLMESPPDINQNS